MRASSVCAFALAFGALLSTPALAQSGQITGTVTDAEGHALAGVAVTVEGAESTALTGATGAYRVRVPSGVYTVTFAAADYSERAAAVEVAAHETTRLDRELSWSLPFATATVVQSAGLRVERLLEAAAAATVVTPESLDTRATEGRIPPALEGALGAEVTESGLTDFTVNARGQNDLLNPRLGVRVDGRDTSMLFFGGQEWAALTMPIDSVAQLELLQGPASALYGGDAANGLLSVVTRRESAGGGRVRVGGGEASTVQGDLIWAPRVGTRSHLELQGSYRDGDLFSVSRNQGGEYAPGCSFDGQTDCLPLEAVPLREDSEDTTTASIGFEHAFDMGFVLYLDGGAADIGGSLLLSDLGRLQVLDSGWSWGRAGITSRHWDLSYGYRDRDASRQLALATGDELVLEERSWNIDVRTNWTLSPGVDFMIGLTHEDEEVGTAAFVGDPIFDEPNFRPRSMFNPAQRDGSLFWGGLGPIEEDADAAFAQVDWQASERVRLVFGARWDDGSYFEPQWSPRASLIFEINPRSSIRLGVGQGFRAPTYEELYLQFDLAPAVNLAVLEPQCRLQSVTCGFDLDLVVTEADAPNDPVADTRLLIVGNENLDVEETQSFELGYRGQLGDLGFLTINLHHTDHDDLIVGPLPQVGTSLGRLNPSYGAYVVPREVLSRAELDELELSELPSREEIRDQLVALLGGLFPFLSANPVDGTPLVALASYANLGSTQSLGVDVGFDLRFAGGFRLELNYSWLDADLDAPPGLADFVLPNAPENRATVGLGYSADRWSARLLGRWVDDFRWVSPPFHGNVDSYSTADLFAHVQLSSNVALGLSVANLTDEEHFQVFGGDLLERRAMGSLTLSW
ncbi:MAG TPA: TonB-dependent receptor [Thermoanaerobaculia bacterium]|nr:TonB-dependent receptor [Thermoanaerobaculia bacterium]